MGGAAHFILYVSDQARATEFYTAVLATAPRLDVPGMTEFVLTHGAVLGLMPAAAIERLLGDAIECVASSKSAPRAELYLLSDEPERYHARALSAGARELSALSLRSWGHSVAYSMDLDGHVLAFARE